MSKSVSNSKLKQNRNMGFTGPVIKTEEKWFDLLPKGINRDKSQQKGDDIVALKSEAENLHNSDTNVYQRVCCTGKKGEKDFNWIKNILQTGTLADRISAHTLLIQDSPVHNLRNIEALVNMINIKGKRECHMAIDALKELFVSDLLADDRKLRFINEQPLSNLDEISKGNANIRKKILILWLFEDKLKALYEKFVHSLETVSHDTVEKSKKIAIGTMFYLLKSNPEQEQFLLEKLCNKIGDPVATMGSHVCHLLKQLLTCHRDMKGIVVQEVERVLFRPNIADRAKYYCVCFLNQTILSHDESDLANHLILLYFAQFKACITKGEVNTKMMSGLLSGVARAFPYSKLKDNVLMEQLDALYKLIHLVSFNIGIQALMLIFQVLDARTGVSDRFYCALYRKILDPALSRSTRQAMFLNLICRALKKDVALVRVKAFVKRLLQVALYQEANLQCAILLLVSEVRRHHPRITQAQERSFAADSDSDEHYEDVLSEEEGKTKVKIDANSPSWVHRKKRAKKKMGYDLHHRNPLYAGAEFCSMWELLLLKLSYHPSVSLFASQLSRSTEIKYSGDPLIDFTTNRFLERFVYKNPKKVSEKNQSDVYMHVFGRRKLKALSAHQAPVTSSQFLKQPASRVPPEEKFIYHYLKQNKKQKEKDKKQKEDSDIESVDSDEFDKLLDDMGDNDREDFAEELNFNRKREGEDSEEDSLLEEDFKEMRPKKKKARKQKQNHDELLASAEELGVLLEDNAGTTVDTTSTEAFHNQDKAAAKQLAWEIERDKFVRGVDWKTKKKEKKSKFVHSMDRKTKKEKKRHTAKKKCK